MDDHRCPSMRILANRGVRLDFDGRLPVQKPHFSLGGLLLIRNQVFLLLEAAHVDIGDFFPHRFPRRPIRAPSRHLRRFTEMP